MDTGTHFAFGFGLAGLSQLDPSVAGDPWTSFAVMLGTIAGSQAPDVDTVTKLRGNAAYVRHHRGISHSIPLWFIWTAAISLSLWLVFPQAPLKTLLLWVFIAVIVHVFTDLFNSYGTQALRPFSSKWIAWNIIHIFDPFIFASQSAAVVLWFVGAAPAAVLFPALYAALALYYIWRTVVHVRIARKLPRADPEHAEGDRYTVLPTVNWTTWYLVKKKADGHYVMGYWIKGSLIWNKEFSCESAPEIEASRKHPDVAAFLSFSAYPCVQMEKSDKETIVRWADARYLHRKEYPFVAVVKYNERMDPVFSYVGWISDDKLVRRINRPSGIIPERR